MKKIGSNAVDEAYKNKNFTNCINVKSETFTKITDEINNFAKYIHIDYKNLFDGKDIILNKTLSNNKTKQFNISKLSSGESQIVGIFARIGEEIIANEKNVVLCIDEPETNLHPSWQSKIIKTSSKLVSDIADSYQIFSATHSGYIVQNLINDVNTLLLSIIYNENSKRFSLEKLNTNNSFILKPIFLCEINYVIFGISSFEYFILLYEHLFHILKDATLISDYNSFDCYLNKEFSIPIDVQKNATCRQTSITRLRHLLAHGYKNEENYLKFAKNEFIPDSKTIIFYNKFENNLTNLIKDSIKLIRNIVMNLKTKMI